MYTIVGFGDLLFVFKVVYSGVVNAMVPLLSNGVSDCQRRRKIANFGIAHGDVQRWAGDEKCGPMHGSMHCWPSPDVLPGIEVRGAE